MLADGHTATAVVVLQVGSVGRGAELHLAELAVAVLRSSEFDNTLFLQVQLRHNGTVVT